MKTIYVALGFLLLTVSCKETPKEKPVDTKKLEAARKKDSINNTPDKLIAKVWNEVFNERFENLKAIADTIRKRHPNSPELKTADSLVAMSIDMIAERNAKWEKAFKSMREKKDEVEGTAVYKDMSSPQFVDKNGFFLWFDNTNHLYLRIQFYGDDWLFIERYTVKTDYGTGELHAVDIQRDNNANVWEWCTFEVTPSIMDMINNVRMSKSVTIRSTGKQYYRDRNLSKKEIEAVNNVMMAYWHHGGKLGR